MNYCSSCAAPIEERVPAGDNRVRHVCPACDRIHYVNPRVVVGSLPVRGDRFLLCRRAIEPRRGLWTIPAGFLELGETAEQGALREAIEEANARLEITGLLAVYDLVHIGQLQLFYSSRLLHEDVSAGPESLEVGLFRWEEIPRDEIAFPSVHWVLDHYRKVQSEGPCPPDVTPADAFSQRLRGE